MIVAFDTSVLVYLFDGKANAPIDPATGAPVSDCKDRLDFLIATLQRDKAKIIIPTPALAELLVRAGAAGPDWLTIVNRSRYFRIMGFDVRAAVEFAATQAAREASGEKTEGANRAKAKFDDQIVAIAAIERATVIYSDDPHIKKLAGERFTVIGVADLPLPPSDAQGTLDLESPAVPNAEGREVEIEELEEVVASIEADDAAEDDRKIADAQAKTGSAQPSEELDHPPVAQPPATADESEKSVSIAHSALAPFEPRGSALSAAPAKDGD